MGESVKGADPQVVGRHFEQRLDSATHFGGGLVGEGDGQQSLWRDTFDVDQPGGAMRQDAGLAAAGAGDDQQWLERGSNRLPLCIVKGFENRSDVHCHTVAQMSGAV